MNSTQFQQGSVMTFARYEGGERVIVQFWIPHGAEAFGFGIKDGRMVRLDVQGGFQRYEI